MKDNKSLIFKITLIIVLIISFYLIISGLATKEEVNNNEILETGLIVNPTSIKLEVGEEKEVSATIVPENATYKNLNWDVGNPNIISLNNNIVKGVNPGTTFIKVTTEKQKITRVISVTVASKNENIPITKIILDKDNVELHAGEKLKVQYKIEPSNATNNKVSFSTSDKSIVAFDKEGNLVGVSEGVATITLKSSNNVTATIKVTVKKALIPISNIKLSNSDITLNIGEEKELKVSYEPTNASDKSVTWSTSNPKIVTVTNGKIKGISKGDATITAKTNNGKTATAKVKVTKSEKINKIHFIKQSAKTSYPGDAILLESNNHYAMIDTGYKSTDDNKFVYNYLKSIGVKELDFILITHNHSDHIGGAEYLIKSDINIDKFYIKTYIGKDDESSLNIDNYNNVIKALNNKKIPIVYIEKSFKDGDSITLSDMNIKLYNTVQLMNQSGYVGGNENNNSVMELVIVNNKKIFLTADSYSGSIMEKLSKEIGKVDVMKLPHHGFSSCSLNSERAKRLSPSYLIVTNVKIAECSKNFDSNIPIYFTKTTSKDAIVVNISNKIYIDK